MRYIENNLIWENYRNPKEGVVPVCGDQMSAAKTDVDPDESKSDEVIKMIMSDLNEAGRNIRNIVHQIELVKELPPWIQSKVAISSQYISDVAKFVDADAQEAAQHTDKAGISAIMVAI